MFVNSANISYSHGSNWRPVAGVDIMVIVLCEDGSDSAGAQSGSGPH